MICWPGNRRVVFQLSVESISRLFCLRIATLCDCLKISRHFLNQSEVKPNQSLLVHTCFLRAWRRVHVFALSSDWFIGLSASGCDWPEWLLWFGFDNIQVKTAIDVVVQLYPWFNYDFPSFFSILMYDKKYKTKENQNWIKDKIKLQHTRACNGSNFALDWTFLKQFNFYFPLSRIHYRNMLINRQRKPNRTGTNEKLKHNYMYTLLKKQLFRLSSWKWWKQWRWVGVGGGGWSS